MTYARGLFYAFEYEDNTKEKLYNIRHFKKTVKEFDRYELEEELTKQTTDYYKKNPLTNEKKNEA